MDGKLKISIYSHEDEYIDLLYTSDKEFIGQCTNPILTVNANGAKTLSLDLPLRYYDTNKKDFVDNIRWEYITNQYKIRVERENEDIEEFVLRDYTETHSDTDQLIININCMSLAEFELGQTGYNLSFNEESLNIYPDNVDPNDPDSEPIGVEDSDIHFWASKILENTDWTYKVKSYYDIDNDMEEDNRQIVPTAGEKIGTNQFYEKDRIIDYDDDNNPIKKDSYDIKERIIKAEKSNRWNLIQDLCENFEVWADFKIVYKNKKIESKTVIFRNDIPEDALFSVRYTKNLKSISRQVDDSQIVTKMYVTPLTNPNTDDGTVAIANNEKNFLKENYLLDFSWYLGDKRTDTDLKNKQLINPDLSMNFKATEYALPAIEAHTVNNTKDLIEDYKKNLRQRNKYINDTAQKLNKAKEELTDLKTQYEYYLGQRDSALEEVNKIIDEVTLLPKGAQFKENKIIYLYEENGYTIVKFSEVGIKSLPNSALFRSPNNVADLDGNLYTDDNIKSLQLGIYKTEPITGTITEAYLINGRIGEKQDYAAFRLNVEYYPLEFNIKLKEYWKAKVQEAVIELARLGRGRDNGDTAGAIYDKEIEVDNLKLDLFLSQLEKKKVVDEFEQLLSPFIREGYWEDTNYTTYMNKIDTLINQVPTELPTENILPSQQWTKDYWCYKIPNKLLGQVTINGVVKDVYLYDIIDINSIEVMNNSIVNSEYDENFKVYVKGPNAAASGTDYTVEYGFTNRDRNSLENRGIYINFYEPEDGTIFTQTADTRMYVRAKARGTNYYIYEGYLNNQTYTNSNGKKERMFYSPFEQILTIDHEDVILSSIVVTANTAGVNYVNDTLLQLVPSNYTLVYGTDYYTYKETIDNKVYTRIKLQYTTNVPIMTFDKNGAISNYQIDCNYDVTSKYYYNDALDTMKESSIPQVTYTISVANLEQLLNPQFDYSNFKPVVGTRIPIYDEELKFNGLIGFINSISFNLLEPQNTEITISNFKDKFEDLFQKITAATIQLQNKGDYYDYATTITNNQGVINKDLLEDTLMQNNLQLKMSPNNEVVWSEKGIEVTNKEKNENGIYGKLKITSNGLFISDSYDQYGNYKWETAITPSYINANKITVGRLDTRQIQIWNSSQPRFLWNENGIYAYGEDKNKQTDYNTYVLYNQNGLQFRQQVIRTEGTKFINLIQNSNFLGTYTNQWSTDTNATLDISKIGDYNCLISEVNVGQRNLAITHHTLDLNAQHKYYFRATVGLENVDATLQHQLIAGLKDFSKTVSYNVADGMITISNIISGADTTKKFEASAVLSEIASNWKLKLTQPMLLDLTATFGDTITSTIEELDKLPFFIDDYTYTENFTVYKDMVSLTWNGLGIDTQDGALSLSSTGGLEVLQPKATSINGVDKQLRVQVGKWDALEDNKTITKYGIRGLDDKGNTFFEVSQKGFLISYGGINDTIDNIIDGAIAYTVTIQSSNGNVFKNRQINTVLKAIVMKGQEDVTNQLSNSAFIWTRSSKNAEADTAWNQSHLGVGSQIEIGQADVDSQATFNCSIQL